jgi:hypothetical protein
VDSILLVVVILMMCVLYVTLPVKKAMRNRAAERVNVMLTGGHEHEPGPELSRENTGGKEVTVHRCMHCDRIMRVTVA